MMMMIGACQENGEWGSCWFDNDDDEDDDEDKDEDDDEDED